NVYDLAFALVAPLGTDNYRCLAALHCNAHSSPVLFFHRLKVIPWEIWDGKVSYRLILPEKGQDMGQAALRELVRRKAPGYIEGTFSHPAAKRARGIMYFLRYEVLPSPNAARLRDFGNTIALCWIRQAIQANADLQARISIEQAGWEIRYLEEAYPVKRED